MIIESALRSLKREFLGIFQIDLTIKETEELKENIKKRALLEIKKIMATGDYELLKLKLNEMFLEVKNSNVYEALNIEKLDLFWVSAEKELFKDLIANYKTIKGKTLTKKELKLMQLRIILEELKEKNKNTQASYLFYTEEMGEIVETGASVYWVSKRKTIQATKIFSFEKPIYNESVFYNFYKEKTKALEEKLCDIETLFRGLRKEKDFEKLLKESNVLLKSYRGTLSREEIYGFEKIEKKRTMSYTTNKALSFFTNVTGSHWDGSINKTNIEELKRLTKEEFENFLTVIFWEVNMEKEHFKSFIFKKRRF